MCQPCRRLCTARRKTNAFAQQVFSGAVHYTHADVQLGKLPFLCKRCVHEAASCSHLCGGFRGKSIVSQREVDAMATQARNDALLEAYGRLGKLDAREQAQFLDRIRRTPGKKQQTNLTWPLICELLEHIPRVAVDDDSGGGDGGDELICFDAARAAIRQARCAEVRRLALMVPPVVRPREQKQKELAEKRRRRVPTSTLTTSLLPSSSSSSSHHGKRRSSSSTSSRKPRRQVLNSYTVTNRLLCRYSHKVSTLGGSSSSSNASARSIVNNLYLMRY
jgi:hypothetical protein